MAFCQIANIRFQYGSSLREYASHKGGALAQDDFLQFYKADNCDAKAWIDFALGRSPTVDLSSIKNLTPARNVPPVDVFDDQGTDYRANYILALKIASLAKDNIPPGKAVIDFIEWMEASFRFGSSAFLFTNLLFSPNRIGKMLKKKTLQDIRNVAWDFSLIQHWRRCAFRGLKQNNPVLLITRDKVVKYLANRMVAADAAELEQHIVTPWGSQSGIGKTIFSKYMETNERISSRKARPQIPDRELDEIITKMEIHYLAS